jgi:hypothetical protein
MANPQTRHLRSKFDPARINQDRPDADHVVFFELAWLPGVVAPEAGLVPAFPVAFMEIGDSEGDDCTWEVVDGIEWIKPLTGSSARYGQIVAASLYAGQWRFKGYANGFYVTDVNVQCRGCWNLPVEGVEIKVYAADGSTVLGTGMTDEDGNFTHTLTTVPSTLFVTAHDPLSRFQDYSSALLDSAFFPVPYVVPLSPAAGKTCVGVDDSSDPVSTP